MLQHGALLITANLPSCNMNRVPPLLRRHREWFSPWVRIHGWIPGRAAVPQFCRGHPRTGADLDAQVASLEGACALLSGTLHVMAGF